MTIFHKLLKTTTILSGTVWRRGWSDLVLNKKLIIMWNFASEKWKWRSLKNV